MEADIIDFSSGLLTGEDDDAYINITLKLKIVTASLREFIADLTHRGYTVQHTIHPPDEQRGTRHEFEVY